MKSNDLINEQRGAIREKVQSAIRSGNAEEFAQAFDEMLDAIIENIEKSYDEKLQTVVGNNDSAILNARGVRQLTSNERGYYQSVIDAMKSENPKQALANLDKTLPIETVNGVFNELRTEHPLLSELDFYPANGFMKILVDNGIYNEAEWGELCDEIVKELSAGFNVVDAALYKLSALMFTCKSGFEIGPEWLESYVREVLYEAFANGAEAGFVNGNGKKAPIGMTRQVGDDVVVVGGVYPKKKAITVNEFDIATVGNLAGLLTVSPSGKARTLTNLIMVVHPADYYTKVMPATMILGADGVYRSILPYPVKIITSTAVEQGEAVFGVGKGYFAALGLEKNGRIEFSDHYQFAEDKRTWIIKGYGNGRPKDNNYFLLLDIRNVKAPVYRTVVIDERTKSSNAALAALSIGNLALSPEFDPNEYTYTASTTNATNIIRAIPADAGATVAIEVDGTPVENNTAIAWETGSNVVTITVTAEDGTTNAKTTITVTKS